jgi:hypothetical protein
MVIFKAKPIVNKSNGQINFNIPRKKFKMFKDGIPKTIKFKIDSEDIEW